MLSWEPSRVKDKQSERGLERYGMGLNVRKGSARTIKGCLYSAIITHLVKSLLEDRASEL